MLGSPLAFTPLGLAVAVLFLRRGHRRAVLWWAGALLGAGIFNGTLKLLIHRARPDTAETFLGAFSYSLPSGHALGSTVTYGLLAYLLIRYRVPTPAGRGVVVAGAAALVAAICISRLYLGVHYFSDVMAGLAFGGLWLAACLRAASSRLPHGGSSASASARSGLPPHRMPTAPP